MNCVIFRFSDGEKFEICMDVYNQTDYDVEWRFQMNTGIMIFIISKVRNIF